jgi:hypothetical protein
MSAALLVRSLCQNVVLCADHDVNGREHEPHRGSWIAWNDAEPVPVPSARLRICGAILNASPQQPN